MKHRIGFFLVWLWRDVFVGVVMDKLLAFQFPGVVLMDFFGDAEFVYVNCIHKILLATGWWFQICLFSPLFGEDFPC